MKGQCKNSIARVMGLMATALTAAIIAGPAHAQSGTISPPAGCEAFLTVQSRSCQVSHYWSCEHDAPGTRWNLTIVGDEARAMFQTDAEYRWHVILNMRNGMRFNRIDGEADPVSLSNLLSNGEDAFAFSMEFGFGSGAEGQAHYSGFDRLTGEEVVIDGQRLLRTEYTYEFDLGRGLWHRTGSEYLSPDDRQFFGGTEVTTRPDGASRETDTTPVEFIRPGEEGFLAETPIYDCEDTNS